MDVKFIALVAFIDALFVAYVCLCRLNAAHVNVIPSVRFKYSMLLMGSIAYGAQPILFNEWPSAGGMVLLFCVTAGLIAGFERWKDGPPADTLKPEIQPQGGGRSSLS